MAFELDFLLNYDDESLLEEIRRVASLVPNQKLTRKAFDAHAKISASAVGKRFGSWGAALERAGLGNLFEDSTLRKNDTAIQLSRADLLSIVGRLAKELGRNHVTREEFQAHTGSRSTMYLKLFGSWKNLLDEAGLVQTPHGRRYTDEECFENLLAVWTEYGRAPQHDEMNKPPSQAGSKAYVLRWGTWRKALAAFVDRVNRPSETGTDRPTQVREKLRLRMLPHSLAARETFHWDFDTSS